MNAARALWAEWANPFTTREVSHRAVNALPAIADLLDAIEAVELLDEGTTGWLMPLLAARDAVAAALTGDTDG